MVVRTLLYRSAVANIHIIYHSLGYTVKNVLPDEAELFGQLLELFTRQYGDVQAALASGADISYEQMHHDVFLAMASPRGETADTRFNELRDKPQFSAEELAKLSSNQLNHMAATHAVAGHIVENTKRKIQESHAKLQSGEITQDEFDDKTKKLFSEERAASIASTEITRTRAATAKEFALQVKELGGPNLALFSWAQRDERTCPLCGARHQHPCEETVMEDGTRWKGVGFPPFHPRCRCEVRVQRAVPFPGTSPSDTIPPIDEGAVHDAPSSSDANAKPRFDWGKLEIFFGLSLAALYFAPKIRYFALTQVFKDPRKPAHFEIVETWFKNDWEAMRNITVPPHRRGCRPRAISERQKPLHCDETRNSTAPSLDTPGSWHRTAENRHESCLKTCIRRSVSAWNKKPRIFPGGMLSGKIRRRGESHLGTDASRF